MVFLDLIRSLNFKNPDSKYILFFEYLNCGFHPVFFVISVFLKASQVF